MSASDTSTIAASSTSSPTNRRLPLVWALKNWKAILTGLLLLALVLAGAAIYRAGKARADLEHSLQTKTALANHYREQAIKVAGVLQQHNERAKVDAEKITQLNGRITSLNDYVETLQDRDRECLSGPDVDRLRDLWNDGSAPAATPPAAR
jgi:uncharacterized protein HemX